MSAKSAIRSFPSVLKVGFSEAVAYRAEMLVWVLATTMPLIMLGLWSAVASEAPVGRFGPSEFTAYFLSTFIVRQLTGSWAAWQMNFEVRNGTLAVRLLRPFSPLLGYAAQNLAALPMRVVVSIPIAAISLLAVGAKYLPRSAALWAVWCVAMLGGWLITFLINVLLGTLSLFIESSIKVMEVYLAAFFVFSGYLIPVEAFSPAMRRVLDWMPFRYQIGFPVELMTSAHALPQALGLLLNQWLWVAVLGGLTLWCWRAGVKRFAAYGG